MLRHRFVIAVSVFALAFASGCSSNTSMGSAPTVPSSKTITIGTAAKTVTVDAGTIAATLSFPAASSGSGSLTVVGSTTLPSGDPALSKALRGADALTRLDATSAPTVLAYVTLIPTATITFATFPQFSFTLPSGVTTTNATFELAFLEPGASAWIEPIAGPGMTTGTNPTTLVFSTSEFPSTSLTLSQGQPYQFAVYEPAQSSASASPTLTPTPTATPTAVPSGSVSATPLASASPVPTSLPTPTPTPTPTPQPTSSASSPATATPTPVASGSAPTITSFSPTSGPVGSTVVINGTNFTPPLTITFSGNVQASGSFSATSITVTVPSGAQNGPITVSTQNGTAMTGAFTVTAAPSPTPTPIELP